MSDHLIIFDTTLRDGEQSPGASMTSEEKMRIARQLERLRVDVIEAGFPASSQRRFRSREGYRAARSRTASVCGLARANENDVRRARRARCKGANPARIHTFIASSPIHMQMKLRMTPDQVLEQAVKSVKLGAQLHATTSSSRPRTPAARSPISSAASARSGDQRRAPRPSTSLTPSATRCRGSSVR